MPILFLLGSASRAACDSWKESGDISDSGSSTTSGHWSGGSDISTPSPPHPEASPKYSSEAFSSSQADEGFEMDSDPFLLDEPAPRKRKVLRAGGAGRPGLGWQWGWRVRWVRFCSVSARSWGLSWELHWGVKLAGEVSCTGFASHPLRGRSWGWEVGREVQRGWQVGPDDRPRGQLPLSLSLVAAQTFTFLFSQLHSLLCLMFKPEQGARHQPGQCCTHPLRLYCSALQLPTKPLCSGRTLHSAGRASLTCAKWSKASAFPKCMWRLGAQLLCGGG